MYDVHNHYFWISEVDVNVNQVKIGSGKDLYMYVCMNAYIYIFIYGRPKLFAMVLGDFDWLSYISESLSCSVKISKRFH